jgi:hypothetical protein
VITSWNYGTNSLPQVRQGTIYLREEPWWLALAGWIIDILTYGCHLFHWIKLPTFLFFTRHGHRYSWREYYGDMGEIYHIYVSSPLFNWQIMHRKAKEYHIEIGYEKVKELFGERDAKLFAEQEEK